MAQPSGPKKPVPPFDIDNYLNPFVPRNPVRFLPAHISYWFGHRTHATQRHPYFSLHSSLHDARLPNWYYQWHLHTLFLYSSILVGAFCGVAIIENVFLALPRLSGHTVPIVIASYGAAAILEYNTIESPLAQPRNLVFGHFSAALMGVSITKLFHLLPPNRFEDLRWLAGALSVGCASVTMSFTKTVHPPAGATALLAATNLEIQELGWWLLPLVLLASMLMLASALIVNNGMGRRFPIYWWTPVDLKALHDSRRQQRLTQKANQSIEGDVEKAAPTPIEPEHLSQTATESSDDLRKDMHRPDRNGQGIRRVSFSSIDRIPRPDDTPAEEMEKPLKELAQGESIVITMDKIVVPAWLEISDWEDGVLRILMERMKEHGGDRPAGEEESKR
jgi:hypothetical protein